jgi:broad specificity phosphatase PhoE
MPLRRTLTSASFLLVVCVAAAVTADADDLTRTVESGGHVLMIRHAYAPGTGDPENFKIGDCSTQRNLNDRGRAQARNIGRWFRLRGIDDARVFSSQWCRCLETAELIGLGPVSELPALNSFFDRPQDAEPNLAALREFLAKQPEDGKLILLVTHFVTISGITSESVSSGEGVLLRLTGAGGVDVLGRLDFENGGFNGNM